MQYVSAIVTQTYSDWSVAPLHTPPEKLYLRLERRQEAIHIWYKSTPDDEAMLLRLAYVPAKPDVQVGLMCASPDGKGYDVTFEDYRLTAT